MCVPGDIGTYWDRVLSNLGSTVPFLGSSDTPALSRPGAWAYPDMVPLTRWLLWYYWLLAAMVPLAAAG